MGLQVYRKSWKRHWDRTYRRVSVFHPRHPSSTLFTSQASRTHVRASQTDFPARPDNSLGLTHDSQSERPLRTRAALQPKTAPKKHREHQAVRGQSKPSTDQLLSLPIQSGNREQGPKGSIETKTDSSSSAQSHGMSFESIMPVPMAPLRSAEVIEAQLRSV